MPKHDITRAFKEDDTEVYVKTHSDGVFIDEDELTTLTNYINDTKFETATGTTTNITVNMLDLYNGYSKSFIAYANNNGQATRINGKPLYKPNTTEAPNIIEGKAYTVWYDAIKNCFFLKASAEGNATAENVLADKKFSNDNDTGIAGTMSNRGAVNKTLALNETYTIPEGYHNGSGKVTQNVTTREGYTDSISNAIGGELLYTRIPQGAYFTNGGAGYPEIRTAVSSVISALQSADQSAKENTITGLGGSIKRVGTFVKERAPETTITLGYRPRLVICTFNDGDFFFDLGQDLFNSIPTRIRMIRYEHDSDDDWCQYYWNWADVNSGDYGIKITDTGFTYYPTGGWGQTVSYIAFS